MQELFGVLSSRGEMACNFTDGSAWFPGSRVVYRQYATLYFALLVDAIESELSVLDLIQVIVEVLESRFRNVCELDLVFHSDQAHWLIDEVRSHSHPRSACRDSRRSRRTAPRAATAHALPTCPPLPRRMPRRRCSWVASSPRRAWQRWCDERRRRTL